MYFGCELVFVLMTVSDIQVYKSLWWKISDKIISPRSKTVLKRVKIFPLFLLQFFPTLYSRLSASPPISPVRKWAWSCPLQTPRRSGKGSGSQLTKARVPPPPPELIDPFSQNPKRRGEAEWKRNWGGGSMRGTVQPPKSIPPPLSNEAFSSSTGASNGGNP